jgi:DNA-binding IclR family transcriptional regulator
MAEAKRPQQGVQSVEIALRIAASLAEARSSLPLGELARAANLPPSKAHRYLVSLCRTGLLEQDPRTGRYDLGETAIHLGLEAQSRTDEYRHLDDALRELFEITGQPLAAMTWGGRGPTIVRRLEPNTAIVVSARIGATLSVVGTSSGALFAAFLPKEVVGPVIDAEYQAKPKPLLARHEFLKAVDLARETRLSSVHGGYVRGFDALSAPVFNAQGEIISTLTMLAASGATDLSFEGEMAAELLSSADRLSRRLGYRGRTGAAKAR